MPKIRRTKEEVALDIQQQHKTCCVCNERKHFNEFYNFKNKNDNKSYRCKTCDAKARNNWSLNNPTKAYESMRGRNLKKRFGISLDDYHLMFEQQGCKCAICGTSENNTTGSRKDWNFAVDHDHVTGKIRGLLCNNCNRGLGLLRDSEELLRKAAKYVEEHR